MQHPRFLKGPRCAKLSSMKERYISKHGSVKNLKWKSQYFTNHSGLLSMLVTMSRTRTSLNSSRVFYMVLAGEWTPNTQLFLTPLVHFTWFWMESGHPRPNFSEHLSCILHCSGWIMDPQRSTFLNTSRVFYMVLRVDPQDSIFLNRSRVFYMVLD